MASDVSALTPEPLERGTDSEQAVDKQATAAKAPRVVRLTAAERFLVRQRAMSLVVVLGGLLGLHAWYYWPFLSDDALISLRYGMRLAEGHGLTWSGTERVEGYTDLLWVLLAAGARLLNRDLIGTARTLDFLGALMAIFFVSFSWRNKRVGPVRVASGGLALALCAPLAVWSIGALEHGFMTGLLAAALVLLISAWEMERPSRRTLLVAGGLLAALGISRADGMVLIVGAAAGLLLSRRPSWLTLRSLLVVLAIPVAVLGLQLAFRLTYYGEWVPNTALVKVSFTTDRLLLGLRHVRDGYTPLLPMLGLVIAAVAVQVRRVPTVRFVLPLVVALSWSAYLAVVGGDIFPGWRQLLLAIIPLALVIAEGAEATVTRWPRRGWLCAALCVPVLAGGLWLQTKDPENVRADNEMWEWDGRAIGPMLRLAFGDKAPLLAVDAAGALPYWSRLPSLDMLGLNDKHIATHPPPGSGGNRIGHDLGDGKYVLGRKPDIIAFNNAGGALKPDFRSGREMVRLAAFRKVYQDVLVRGDWGHRPFGWLWIRREDGVLGLRRTDDRIDLPGYFFGGGEAAAVLDDRMLATEVTPTAMAKVPRLEVPKGTWLLSFDPPTLQVEAGFQCYGKSALPTVANGPPSIEVDGTQLIDLVVGTRTPGTHLIRSATLVRTKKRANYRCPPRKGPPTVSIRAMGYIQSERGSWAYPTHIVMREVGLIVRLTAPSHAPAVHLSLDNNDVILLRFRRADEVVGETVVRPKANVAGMAFQRVPVPEQVWTDSYDSIHVIPQVGDGKYSIGHLVLLAD